MPAYESLYWPMEMMGHFWTWYKGSPFWLDVNKIIGNISGSSDKPGNDCIGIMLGDEDVLMDLDMGRKQFAEYRQALQRGTGPKAGDGLLSIDSEVAGMTSDSSGGVRFMVVEGAGHHVQNDVQQETGAEGLLRFVRQC
jgi:hypothetical protein